jgi:hypothetical protein
VVPGEPPPSLLPACAPPLVLALPKRLDETARAHDRVAQTQISPARLHARISEEVRETGSPHSKPPSSAQWCVAKIVRAPTSETSQARQLRALRVSKNVIRLSFMHRLSSQVRMGGPELRSAR